MTSQPGGTTVYPGPVVARLASPPPGWFTHADVVVVGSGVAGLSLALNIRRLGHRVLVVTKSRLADGATTWAQGGIAAALADDDSPAQHERDTLVAGGGLCDIEAVRVLVTQGPHSVRNLIASGAHFDQDDGRLALTREGGHLRDRIAHAGGDATGAEIFRALMAAIADDPGIDLVENALALDLLQDQTGGVQGLTLHVIGEGRRDGVGAVLAPVVVVATGGLGQVFAQTTNPAVATGDGMALALRAGAELADLEFVQFHPTVLYLGPKAIGQQPLISEAVRGEGAFLVDDAGVRFMRGQHPLADLAPRDVVSRAIIRRMHQTDAAHVWLDGRDLGAPTWSRRFPNILKCCLEAGIDPTRDLIPVAPAQHYASGGILTDINGRTSIPGLFAAGEVACTGVHGANRLASNSLLEGLVFPERIVAVIAAGMPRRRDPWLPSGPSGLVAARARRGLQQAMSAGAGVLRGAQSLSATLTQLGQLRTAGTGDPDTATWETTNLHTIATVLAANALIREETRGSHWREDFPETDDQNWRVRLVTHADHDGVLHTRRIPVAAHDYLAPSGTPTSAGTLTNAGTPTSAGTPTNSGTQVNPRARGSKTQERG